MALERKATVSSTDEDKSPISGNLFTAEQLLHNYYIYDDEGEYSLLSYNCGPCTRHLVSVTQP